MAVLLLLALSRFHWRKLADMNNDWVMDESDLRIFCDYWLSDSFEPPSDLDREGIVNFKDFAIFAWLWKEKIEPVTEPIIDENPPIWDNVDIWEITPSAVDLGGGNPEWHYTMSAPATDLEGSDPVWYEVVCFEDDDMSSGGWIPGPSYTTTLYYPTTTAPSLTFKVRTRDSAEPEPNISGWSPWYNTTVGPIF